MKKHEMHVSARGQGVLMRSTGSTASDNELTPAMKEPKLIVGQIWEDNDSRYKGIPPRRRVRVVTIGHDSAVVENVRTGKRSIISLRRFRPTSTGYVLVESPQADAAVDPQASDPGKPSTRRERKELIHAGRAGGAAVKRFVAVPEPASCEHPQQDFGRRPR